MGQESSSGKKDPSVETFTPDANVTNKSSFLSRGDAGKMSVPSIHFAGFGPGEEMHRILPDTLAATLLHALPGNCSPSTLNESKWFLLYNSRIHGRSFQNLIQRIVDKGPTIIVIKSRDSAPIFGGFCEDPWLTVSAREKIDRSRSAALQRATREGQKNHGIIHRPINQSNVFFGGEKCFLFVEDKVVVNGGTIYWSRPSVNSNFMYLFDSHPLEEKEGIAMGGQPGYFGWFLDRWLEKGSCHGARCSTFQNPRLTVSEEWSVDCVEVYAVQSDMVETLISAQVDSVGGKNSGGKTASCLNVNSRSDAEVNKLMLELHGRHQFKCEERPEC